MTSDTTSEPILHSDISVTLPDDEEEIFKAIRFLDLPMLRRFTQLNNRVDVNLVHSASEYTIKSLRLSRHIRLTQYTPLIVAVAHSSLEIIEYLVEIGADVNLSDGTQRTPLHLAVATDRPDVVQYLIKKGADVNAQTKSFRTPLLEAVDVNNPMIVDMLIDAGADLDLGDIKGTTPILDATFLIGRAHRNQQQNKHIVQSLIKGGCSVNKTNNLQATALMMAVGSKSKELIRELLNAGADINHVDNKKRTPFHLLSERDKMTDIALMLLQAGADPNTKDSAGKTPIEKCVKFGKFELIKFLMCTDCQYSKELIQSERMNYLCDLVPVFGKWVSSELGTVKSLQRLCRKTIRNATSTDNLKHLQTLDLPKSLCDFLMFKTG